MRALPAAIVICLCTALAGCHKPAAPRRAAAAAPLPPPPLPVVKAEEVPAAPAQPSVVLEKGMVLSHVAAEAYGHEKFAGIVMKFNKIADPARIKAGTVINTPSIPELFKTEGIDPKYQPAINVLGKAAHDYFAAQKEYVAFRSKAAAGHDSTKITLPAEMKQKLDRIADAIASAAAVFAGATAPHKPPNATVQQFRQAALKIHDLASGALHSPDYDDDMVGQHLGLGMTNALIWVQQQYQ